MTRCRPRRLRLSTKLIACRLANEETVSVCAGVLEIHGIARQNITIFSDFEPMGDRFRDRPESVLEEPELLGRIASNGDAMNA